MNQILSFEENGLGSMKGRVKFFAASLMIFGVILLGKGGYSIAKSQKKEISGMASIAEAEEKKPEISFEQNNSVLTVNVNSEYELSKVTYKWNEEEEKSLLQVSDRKSISEEIDIPTGTNELTINVVYVNGQHFTYEKKETFTSSSTKIVLSVVNNKKIKIHVSDNSGIEYIAYKWNDNEEITKTPEGEDNTQMEALTDIPTGKNTLTVTAVNLFGEKSEKYQDVDGIQLEKPVINAELSANGTFLIDVTSQDNIENVDITVNGAQYKLNISDFIKQGYTVEQLNNSKGLHLEENEIGKITSLKYEFNLQEEVNEVEITATTEYTSETIAGTVIRPNE